MLSKFEVSLFWMNIFASKSQKIHTKSNKCFLEGIRDITGCEELLIWDPEEILGRKSGIYEFYSL